MPAPPSPFPLPRLQITQELVSSGMMNARNLAQLLWSLGKLRNPTVTVGLIKKHPDDRTELRSIGPLKLGLSSTPQEEGGGESRGGAEELDGSLTAQVG